MDSLTRIRLLAVPENGILTQANFSSAAMEELRQQGYVQATRYNSRGAIKEAALSSPVGRNAVARLINEALRSPLVMVSGIDDLTAEERREKAIKPRRPPLT